MADEFPPSSCNQAYQRDFFDEDDVPGAVQSLQGQIVSLMLQGCSSRERPDNGVELIERLLELYKRCRKMLNSVVPIYENFVICKIVNFCYLWRITDNSLIANVLGNYYALHGNFDEIFKFGGGLTGSAWPFNEGLESLEYFLRHSHGGRLLFHGRRFVEVAIGSPVRELAVDYAIANLHHEMALLLFRYGAALRTADENPNGMNELSAVVFLLDIECRRLMSGYRTTSIDENSVQCLRLVLRTWRRAQPQRLSLKICELYHRRMRESAWRNVGGTSDMLEMLRSYVPSLKPRLEGPLQLKHLCRAVARDALYQSWQLPAGIQDLPIPKILKSYLDLAHD